MAINQVEAVSIPVAEVVKTFGTRRKLKLLTTSATLNRVLKLLLARVRVLELAAAICFLTVTVGGAEAADGGKASKAGKFPNIVYLYADDMGYGDVSCMYPEGSIQTPNIDQLASEGIKFTNAHSAASTCVPSRYGLMTGRLLYRFQGNDARVMKTGSLMDKDRMIWPKLLKNAGYKTAAFGKWHLGWAWPWKDKIGRSPTADTIDYTKPLNEGPVDRGFDYYFGVANHSSLPAFVENRHIVGVPDTEVKVDSRKTAIGVEGWDPHEVMPTVARKVVGYIEEHANDESEQPFFAYFAFTSPHVPLVVHKQFQGKSGISPYCDFVIQSDHMVGQVVDALERTGLDQNTLVIFTSDHGSPAKHPGADRMKEGHQPNGIYRGRKGEAWEGGNRIPFIAKWPGRIEAGAVTDALFCQADMLATCAALTGQSKPADAVDSFNGLPLFFGEPASDDGRVDMVHEAQGTFHARKGDWKLIFGVSKYDRFLLDESQQQSLAKSKNGLTDPSTWALYNVADDPGEKNNLIKERPEIAKELEALFKRESSKQ